MQVLDVLRGVDGIIGLAIPLAGDSAFGTVLKIADTTIKSAIIFALAGKDPAVEIQRIHNADPYLTEMRAEWEDRLKQKFGEG